MADGVPEEKAEAQHIPDLDGRPHRAVPRLGFHRGGLRSRDCQRHHGNGELHGYGMSDTACTSARDTQRGAGAKQVVTRRRSVA